MKFLIFLLLTVTVHLSENSRISIKSVTIRHLRKHDFGLIFDTVLLNEAGTPKETLNFEIGSDDCCLFVNNSWDCDTQNVIGAKVSNLEPGKEIIVSLVWPTLILYNRLGNCTLKVVTKRPLGDTVDATKVIHFNTMINTRALHDYMLYYFNDLKKENGYTHCEHEDLDPFNNCKPVNCELKYFGKRNFFKFPHCIEAARCPKDSNIFYDYETNSCKNLKKILTDDELKEMSAGKFTNWIEDEDLKLKSENFSVKLQQSEVLKRVRRSLNESQTFMDMLLSTLLLSLKIIVFIIFIYLMMALLISVIFYLCIGCGIISTSVTMNAFEQFE